MNRFFKIGLIALVGMTSYLSNAQSNLNTDPNAQEDWERFMMPGVSGVFYQPKSSDSLGYFTGFAPEINFYTRWMDDIDGPSYLKTYFKLAVLNSSKDNVPILFTYDFGVSMSFENGFRRKFLIPYFGVEMGGVASKSLKNTFTFVPQVGIILYATDGMSFYTNASYVYAFADTEAYAGLKANAGISLTLWKY